MKTSAQGQQLLKAGNALCGETEVLHYLEVLRDKIGLGRNCQRKAVVKPLTGRKIGAYYGCMLLRPGKEMDFDDPENPKIFEDFIRAIGAEPVKYPQRNECCGGYMALENKARREAGRKIGQCKGAGRGLITACPLCMYNLLQNTDGKLPS